MGYNNDSIQNKKEKYLSGREPPSWLRILLDPINIICAKRNRINKLNNETNKIEWDREESGSCSG